MTAQGAASPAAGGLGPAAGRPRPQPLRVHLTGLVVLFIAAAVLGVLTGWHQAERDAVHAARADARYGARKAAEQIGTSLAVVRRTVDAVTANPRIGRLFTDPRSCQLAFTLGGSADDGHLDVLRPDGTVVCSSSPVAPGRRGAYRGQPWVSAAMRSPQLLAPVTDARTGRPAVVVSAAVPGHGMVAAMVDLAALATVSGETLGGARGLEFLAVAGDGRTIATRWPDPAGWAGRALSDTGFSVPDDGGDAVDVTGRRRLYGRADVPGVGWRIYAGAPYGPALAAAHRLAARQAAVVGTGLLAGLLATALVYRRITRPITRLRTRVRDAAVTGGPTPADDVGGPREVVELGAEFAAVFASAGREIAERRRAEEAAWQHERNYRQMFEASPYPIYLVAVDTDRVVAANEAAVRYYGYPRAELLAMTAARLRADDGPPEPARPGTVERGLRERHVTRDGTVTQVRVTSYLVPFAGQDARCVAVEDVTERELLDQRLRQSERLESLGHLAGGVAHDFNNLLGIINGYAAMSAADVETAAAADPAWRTLHDDLLQIVAAGDRAAGLTRQLLAFARTDAGAEATVVNLNSVVEDIDKLLQRTLGADIRLITLLTDDPWPIKADVGRLEQVLVNLAVNARDAMPGGGTLTIDTDRVTADDHYAAQYPGLRAGRYMRLRVSDTGTGMDKATLERAFEPFFTTKEKGHGTGLGLATIHGIIIQAGGHAHIHSTLGQGTTVVALLPATDEKARTPEAVSLAPESGAGETILLVEDDDQLRLLTERILHRAGYTVLTAGNPDDAQRLAAAADHLDLLLTDVVMPDMNGPTLAALLTADRPGTPVLYMSGYAETILAARTAIPAGATLLNKPISAFHLLTAVTRALAPRPAARSRPGPGTRRGT